MSTFSLDEVQVEGDVRLIPLKDNQVRVEIPDLQSPVSFNLTGSFNGLYRPLEWSQKLSFGTISAYATNALIESFAIVDRQLEVDIYFSSEEQSQLLVVFPLPLSSNNTFYFWNDIKSQQITLPYSLDDSRTIATVDISMARDLLTFNDELTVYSDLQFISDIPLYSLEVSQDLVFLGERVSFDVYPYSENVFYYITTPSNNVLYLVDPSYVPKEQGTYFVEASVHSTQGIFSLYANFSTLQEELSSNRSTLSSMGPLEARTTQGSIEQFSVDDSLTLSLDLSLPEGRVSVQQIQPIRIFVDLPFELKKYQHFYLEDEISGKKVPHQVSTDRNQLILTLPHDFVKNNELKLKFRIPQIDYDVNINRLSESKAQFIIDNKLVTLNTSFGRLNYLAVVDPSQTKNFPASQQRTPLKLIKFSITDVDVGATVRVNAQYDPSLSGKPTVLKYNPQTETWYEVPYNIVGENTLELWLTDGGLGDDDGVANGIIEDDFTIIYISSALQTEADGSFIADISDHVTYRDGLAASVSDTNRIEVKFEEPLQSYQDISVYASSLETAYLDVYLPDEQTLLFTLGPITQDAKYTKYLPEISPTQDFIFKARGSLLIDQIVDPLYEGADDTGVVGGCGLGYLGTGDATSDDGLYLSLVDRLNSNGAFPGWTVADRAYVDVQLSETEVLLNGLNITWNVYCQDKAGNSFNTTTRSITFNVTAPTTTFYETFPGTLTATTFQTINLSNTTEANADRVTLTVGSGITGLQQFLSADLSNDLNFGPYGLLIPASGGVDFYGNFDSSRATSGPAYWDLSYNNGGGFISFAQTSSTAEIPLTEGTIVGSSTLNLGSDLRLESGDSIRLDVYANKTITNPTTYYHDWDQPDNSGFDLQSYPLGALTIAVIDPPASKSVNQTDVFTVTCSIGCTSGWCFDAEL